MEHYSQLSRAQLSFDYLHTNSTTHEFLFGAIAELIDNSRDAGATELDIFTIKDAALRGGYMLYFVDNGGGMTPEEARNVIVFGKSFKRSVDGSSIGMYGNGLKSGSMRVGSDMILFTKREGIFTCLFLSRTFHEDEKLDEVIVPLPTFNAVDKSPMCTTPEEQKKHDVEMQIILKYSPFRCTKDFFSQFDKLKGDSGTLVIIYNMKLMDNGSPELDIITDPKDVLLTASSDKDDPMEPLADIELPPERRSLRAYVSILYADPRMKVYIQGRKVQTKRLLDTLYAAKRYNYASKTFRMRAERDLAKAKNDVKIAELRAKEAESKARDCEIRYEDSKDPEHLKLVRRLNNAAAEMRSLVTIRQNTVARKQKALKDPKTLTFYFGMNVVNRACDGMFVYNCSRLIKMYQRIGPQQDSSMMCRGVVGIVDVPYMVLEPTHNKQDFADAKEYRQLMRAMADHLMQYWDDLSIDKNGCDDTNRFWKSFGYLSARWRDPPSDEDKYARKRYSCVSICVQCDKCLRWRVLPYSQSQIGREVPDNWQCRDNPDQKHRRCDVPEEDMCPPMGVLKRKIKTKEQRQAELEAQIRKKQEELEQILDPDDEVVAPPSGKINSEIASSRGKRPSRPPSPPPVSSKKPAAPSSPVRATTLADKRRLSSSVPANASSKSTTNRISPSLPLPTSVSKPKSGGLVPKFNSAAKPTGAKPSAPVQNRRRLHRESEDEESEDTSEEDDDDEEEDEDDEEEEEEEEEQEEATVTSRSKTSKPVEEKTPDKSDSKKSSLQTNAVAPESGSTLKNRQTDAATGKQPANEVPKESEGQPVSANTNLLPNGSVGKQSNTTINQLTTASTVSHEPSVSSVPSSANHALVEKIVDKFKVCLRYFLPPQWPMQKDRIHTLTELELAEFPLEDFFDRYEQGLRALLANFQQETQLYNDTLQNIRRDVILLLEKKNPDLKARNLEGDAIDQLLRETLTKDD